MKWNSKLLQRVQARSNVVEIVFLNNRPPSDTEQANIIATNVASQNDLSALPSATLVFNQFQQVTAKWTCLTWTFCYQPLVSLLKHLLNAPSSICEHNSIQSASTHISLNLSFSAHPLINFSQYPNIETLFFIWSNVCIFPQPTLISFVSKKSESDELSHPTCIHHSPVSSLLVNSLLM